MAWREVPGCSTCDRRPALPHTAGHPELLALWPCPAPPPRSADLKHATKVVQEIKLLRSTVAQRDKERAERATLVAQEKLVQGGCLGVEGR